MMIPRPREADESSAIGETDFRQSMDYGCGMVAHNSTRNDIQCGANLTLSPLYIGRERRGERGTTAYSPLRIRGTRLRFTAARSSSAVTRWPTTSR